MIHLSFSYSIIIYFYARQNLHGDSVSEQEWHQRRVKWKVIRLVGPRSYVSTVYILCNSLACFLFLCYTYFHNVTFNQAQEKTGVGLISFLFTSKLEKLG